MEPQFHIYSHLRHPSREGDIGWYRIRIDPSSADNRSFSLSSKRLTKSECTAFLSLCRRGCHTISVRHPGKTRELPPRYGQSVCVPWIPSQTPRSFLLASISRSYMRDGTVPHSDREGLLAYFILLTYVRRTCGGGGHST